MANNQEEQKHYKANAFTGLMEGDRLSETQYYEVLSVREDHVVVKNERGFQFQIGKKIIEEGMYSASQYQEEKFVTRTELIDLLSNSGDSIFTVSFMKLPTAKEINEGIKSINKGKILPNKEIEKVVKDAFDGTERVLTGYLLKTETGFGRSMVIDLMIPENQNRIRQVDHRTILWYINKGVKYSLKK